MTNTEGSDMTKKEKEETIDTIAKFYEMLQERDIIIAELLDIANRYKKRLYPRMNHYVEDVIKRASKITPKP